MAEQVESWWRQLGESRAREAGNGRGNEQAGRLVGCDHRGQVGWSETEDKLALDETQEQGSKTRRPEHTYHTG